MSLVAAAWLLVSAGPAEAQRRRATPQQQAQADAQVAAFTSPTLTRFSGEEEFARYVAAVRAAARARGEWWASRQPLQFAELQTEVQKDVAPALCPEDAPECRLLDEEAIVVTGSAVRPSNPSITNNQMRDVEEGDIVKQIDRFLLVLQDGRIFVIDIDAPGNRPARRRIALTDRQNVYRNPASDTWYDEMLVFGNRVLVTGYSYDNQATELAVFRLDPSGRLSREGIFHLSSNDYFSSSNYATRLIGDSLVTYTPIHVEDLAAKDFQWPIVRRWRPENDRSKEPARGGRPLLDAASIYKPAATTFEPAIHTVSVCPLRSAARRGNLECRSTAVVGPAGVTWYVTKKDVYLWTAADALDYSKLPACSPRGASPSTEAAPAIVYRVAVTGASPTLLAARGRPPDQFAMQAGSDRLMALLNVASAACEASDSAPTPIAFFSVALDRFSTTLSPAQESHFTALPSVGSYYVASRFTDRYVVYGGLSRFRRGLPDLEGEDDSEWRRRVEAEPLQPAWAVPLSLPSSPRRLEVGHTVIRAERVADDIVLTGYRDRGGLLVTLVDLDVPVRIASQTRLHGRYESEGRSHAFNSLVESDGSGLMGLPTVTRVEEGTRDYWRSSASDLSFFKFAASGTVRHLGELERHFDYSDDGDSDVPGYRCEVSCIDWYGNSRPIFTDGRVFALAGAELIEGRVESGAIREVQRLNIALASPTP